MWRREKSDSGDGLDDCFVFGVVLTLHISLLRLFQFQFEGFKEFGPSYLLHDEPAHTMNNEYQRHLTESQLRSYEPVSILKIHRNLTFPTSNSSIFSSLAYLRSNNKSLAKSRTDVVALPAF